MRTYLSIALFISFLGTQAQAVLTQRIDVPDSIVEMCNALFLEELGEEMYLECLTFDSASGTSKTYPNAQNRIEYKLYYTFSFPGVKEARFPLQMNYSLYSGELHVQSSRFLRWDRTDLPRALHKKGTEIINYQEAKNTAQKVFPEMQKPQGHFVLGRDYFYWHFTEYTEINDPKARIETYLEKHVHIDLYSGEIISSYTK